MMIRFKSPASGGLGRAVTILFAVVPSFLVSTPSESLSQAKQPPGFDEFGKWESLSPAGARGGLSPDGGWIAYSINRTNRENELRVRAVAGGDPEIIPYGSQPVYSSDSNWLAYRIGHSQDEQERLREAGEPVRNRMGLRNLLTGNVLEVEGVSSFSLSPGGAYLAMHRYPPDRDRGPSGGGGGEAALGTTVIVRELESGHEISFGNVSAFEWQPVLDGRLLAMVISAEDKTGNGIHLYDPESSELRVLDSSDSDYTNLSWRDDSSDLTVLRSKDQGGKDGSTNVILAWTGIGGSEAEHAYDPTEDPAFPPDMRIVPFRGLSWSGDGDVLFLGVAPWEDDISGPEKGGDAPGGEEEGEEEAEEEAEEGAEEGAGEEDPSTVEIWHWTDVFVMPWQKAHAAQDRERNMLAAWHLGDDRFVRLGQDLIEERVTPVPYSDLAVVAEWSRYAFERSIGRPGADLYLQDIATGDRTLLKENINDRYVQVSPGGQYLLYMDDGHFWTIDLETLQTTNITEPAPISFINEESDQTSKVYPDRLQKPPFGTAGWVVDDEAVLLYDKYDLWAVASDGSGAERLTAGAEEEVRHRLVRPERGFRGGPAIGSSARGYQWVNLDEPQYLSLYGEWTKKSGYGRLDPNGDVERLVWLDKNVGSLAKAEKAEVYAYITQAFDDSPDIFVGGRGLGDAEQVSETNPFQNDYAWGRSELVDYVTDKGRKMQGALIYPAGYEPGKKYPMIVYNYELLSQNLHRYVAPSDRSYYNTAVFMTQGYFVLQPDIVFRTRQPGWSVVECISAAVEAVIEKGLVDPDRVGIVGHSMGGFNTSFVATHTHGMFAAAVAGAPMTDLVSYYGDHHWGSGVAETDHIETGQERMEVALYEDLQAYIDNSAVYGAHEMSVPLLLEAGDQDGIVAWYQAIELYNIARRAKKNVVMLGYIGEDHGLRQEANQKDYQRRILAWFGHYLKGEPADPWITSGKSFLEREAELKRKRDGG